MRVLRIRQSEQCLEGDEVLEYELEEPWTRSSIVALGEIGELEYYADFPRPFFRVHVEGGMVKGVEGASGCQVILPRTRREDVRSRINAALRLSQE
jgi:hypothetical protein